MISLPADLTEMVRARVSAGGYSSEEDVLHAALDALAEREAANIASIRRGLADIAAGRSRPFEVAEAEFRKRNGLEANE